MNITNFLLLFIIIIIAGSDFLLSKFKKPIGSQIILKNKNQANQTPTKNKFYKKSYFLILIISFALFLFSFFFEIRIPFSGTGDYYSFTSQDLIVALCLISVYTFFSINSVLVKLNKKKIFAREILYLCLNIAIVLIFALVNLTLDLVIDGKITDLSTKLNNVNLVMTDNLKIGDEYYLDFTPTEELINDLGLGQSEPYVLYESKFKTLFKYISRSGNNGHWYMDYIVSGGKYKDEVPSKELQLTKNILGDLNNAISLPGTAVFYGNEVSFVDITIINSGISKWDKVFGAFSIIDTKKTYTYSSNRKKYYFETKGNKRFESYRGPGYYYYSILGNKYVHPSETKMHLAFENLIESEDNYCKIWKCETIRTLSNEEFIVDYKPSDFEIKYNYLLDLPTIFKEEELSTILNSNYKLSETEISDFYDIKTYYIIDKSNYEALESKIELERLYLRQSLWNLRNLPSYSGFNKGNWDKVLSIWFIAIFFLAYAYRFALSIITLIVLTIKWSIKTYFSD